MMIQQASASQRILLASVTSFTVRVEEERIRITTTLSIGTAKGTIDKIISVPVGGPSVNMTMQKNPQKTTLQITARIFRGVLL